MTQEMVKVWDPLVRVFHWSLVLAFVVAYLSGEGEIMTLHSYAGYGIAGLVVVRLLWGFIGPRHARFSDFVFRPATVIAYLKDLAVLRARRYLGHNPAGGVMVLALLVALSLTTLTGHLVYEGEAAEHSAAVTTMQYGGGHDEDDGAEEGEGGVVHEILEELHEFFSHLTLLLVVVHIGGVLISSMLHGENLPRAMVTGYKRREP